MSVEIKELLDYLNDFLESNVEQVNLNQKRVKQILDYITNLQEENKELNDDNIWWNNRFKAVERDNRNLKAKLEMYENGVYYSSENDELQERIDKAIEYIKRHQQIYDIDGSEDNKIDEFDILAKPKTLLDILGGKDG